MKRCVFISCFDYYNTRIEVLINHFKGLRYEISYFYADFDHFTKTSILHTSHFGTPIKVVRYKRNLSIRRLLSHYFFSKDIMKQLKQIKPDLVYCIIPPNYLVKELSIYKNKNPNVKIVFDIYDMWPESFPYSKNKGLLSLPFSIWRNIRSKGLANADLILCVSQQTKDAIISEAKNKPVKVFKPVIINSDIPEYANQVDKLSFCYLGMVNHIIDFELIDKILSGVAEKKHVTLHIIGEGENLREFVSRLQQHNIEVVCHGCIFNMEEKNKVFALCSLGLNVPRKEINSTMSLKALEYLRAGLPFINNANGDIRNIVSQDKVGINVDGSINNTVKEVLALTENDLILMHQNCVQSYDMRFRSQNLADLFEEVLG